MRYFPTTNDLNPSTVRACDCGCTKMELHNCRGYDDDYTGVRCSKCRATGRYSSDSAYEAIEFWNNRTPRLPICVDTPNNQCDGCCSEMPLRNGIHYNEENKPHMVCTGDEYSS
jgi:hypothetical protein